MAQPMPKGNQLEELEEMITDKKSKIKKILSKPSGMRTDEELREVTSCLAVNSFLSKLLGSRLLEKLQRSASRVGQVYDS